MSIRPNATINRKHMRAKSVTDGDGSTTAPSDGVSTLLQYGDTDWDFDTARG
jgi:hypothetical protein